MLSAIFGGDSPKAPANQTLPPGAVQQQTITAEQVNSIFHSYIFQQMRNSNEIHKNLQNIYRKIQDVYRNIDKIHENIGNTKCLE